MGPVFVCIVIFMCVSTAVTGQPGTSLLVIQKGLKLDDDLRLRCDGMNSTHPLAKGSWLITYASGEEIQVVGAADGWACRLARDMHGARVSCQAHALPRRRLVAAAPGYEIRIEDAGPLQAETFRDVTMIIRNTTYAKGGQLNGAAGEEIEVYCEGRSLPKDKVYMYILQRKGDVEWEVAGALQGNSRLAEASARLTLRDSDHFAQLYCLARWFTNEQYDNPRGLRSKPVIIVIDNSAAAIQLASSSAWSYLWIAVGVGCLGWLVAAVLLGVLCFRRRAQNSSTDATEVRNNHKIGCCVMRNDSVVYAEPAGATVVSPASARSLMAANVKLPPPTTPPPKAPQDEITYSNLEELNAFARKRYVW